MFEDVAAQGVQGASASPTNAWSIRSSPPGERSVSTQQAFDLVALAEVARHEPAATRVSARQRRRLRRFPRRAGRNGVPRRVRARFSSSTAIAAATNRTGRCRGCTRIRRRRCSRSARSCRARRRITAATAAAAGRRGGRGVARVRGAAIAVAALDAAAARALDAAPAEVAVPVARAGAIGPDAGGRRGSAPGTSRSPTGSSSAAGSIAATTTSCCISTRSRARGARSGAADPACARSPRGARRSSRRSATSGCRC